jgi:thiol-disulfide isomerase/thioredoxin
MKKSIILILVVCGIILTGCSKKDDVVPGKLGDPAAELTGLKWIKGDAVTFQPGHVYVVEFWATWCPPCRASIPHLTKLQAQYKDKITIIGVSVDKDPAQKVKEFVDKKGETMEYTVAYEAEGKVSKAYSRAFGQEGIPHAFIVDRQGKITWVGHPMTMDDVLKQVVDGSFDRDAYAKEQKELLENSARLDGWITDYFAKIEIENNEETRKIADRIIENSQAQMLNGFAWKILTEVKEENRDLAIALKAAKKADDLTGGDNAAVLDTYALALFENGKVEEAIARQAKAVELSAGDPEMQNGLKKRLEEFKAALTKAPSPD